MTNLDKKLMKSRAYIDGVWVTAITSASYDVHNPATGNLLGTVPDMGAAETTRAINAASAALPLWRKKTAKERAVLLRAFFDAVMENQELLAQILTAEGGKPLAEARGEIAYGASFLEWFAEEAKRVYGDVIPTTMPGRRILVLKEAIGVCGMITPWNFPNAMITRKLAPALAAGCTVIIKPAAETPFSALALAEIADRIGIPKGVINIVTTSDGARVGGELTSNPLVRKISFTGSTNVGKLLMKQGADTIKKMSLELGGNAPFIVFDDADLEAAVAGAMVSKFRNSGQTCVCVNRFLIQAGIYDQFVAAFKTAVEALKVGNGTDDGTTQGPLINAAAVAKIQNHIEDACDKGAQIILGGRRHALGGNFFQPSILGDVTPAMLVAQEETFGPLAPLFKFTHEAEAIAMANDTEFGLAAYFYTRDMARTWRVAEALEYGMIGINEGTLSTEVAPFGGVKSSGLGREGSKYGIEDYLEIKYLAMGGLKE